MEALFIKLVYIGDLVTVIVGILYDHSVCAVKALNIRMAVSYSELNDSSVGINLPLKCSEFYFTLKDLRYFWNHIVFSEAFKQCLLRRLINLIKHAYKTDFLFILIEKSYVHIVVSYGKKHSRLEILNYGSVFFYKSDEVEVGALKSSRIFIDIITSHNVTSREVFSLTAFVKLIRHRLDLHEAVILTLKSHKLLGSTALYDLTIVNNNDLISFGKS